MSEITREDFQTAFKESARQNEQHSRDSLAAIHSLTEEIRGMAIAISGKSKANGNGHNGNMWPLLFGIGALVFGTMSPLVIMTQAATNQVSEMDQRMRRDDDRERIDAASLATLAERIRQLNKHKEIH
jgi:hypothetical protein